MRSYIKLGLAVLAVVTIAACSRNEAVESPTANGGEGGRPARIGTAPMTHIGVAVKDVNASAKAWSHVLGIPASEVRTVTLTLPDKTTADVKVVSLTMPNTEIELNQPVTERGPVQEHLDRFGPGVHYVGFTVKDNVDEIRGVLEQRGGKWTGGAPGGEYAFVDFRERFGAAVKIMQQTGSSPQTRQPAGTADTTALGNQRVTHVGFAVRSFDEAAKAVGDILDVPPTQGSTTDVVYPPGHRWNPTSTALKIGGMRVTENLWIELIEPTTGPSPWTEWLEKHRGNALQHIGFDAGNEEGVEEWVRVMESKGGTRTVGVPIKLLPSYTGKGLSIDGTFYAYVDFSDTLGLTLAVTAPRVRSQSASR